MTIKPKMYLNASPQTAEEGSLVYAKNVKIDNDGSITSDFGYQAVSGIFSGCTVLGQIVGIDNKIYFLTKFSGNTYEIIEYNELTGAFSSISNCKWTPESDNSTFTGAVTTNISGEKILTIAECPPENSTVKAPLKHINLSCPNVAHKSQYCQAPAIPLCNLVFNRTYSKTIPNGTYVFFIRYKIRDDVFTKWYLASRPCFAGKSENIDTLQGGIRRINIHRDSANSFVFAVKSVNNTAAHYYEGFQIGFILTHDEGTVARAWKYFDFSYNGTGSSAAVNNTIYFDYDDVTEVSIEELTEPTYEIYNVKNVTAFKNKLYISNYEESGLAPSVLTASGVTFSAGIIPSDPISSESNSITYVVGGTTFEFTKNAEDFYVTENSSSSWKAINTGIKVEFSNIYKEGSRIDKDAFSCVICCNYNENPDVAIVYDLRNKLKTQGVGELTSAIFGSDYTKPRTSVLGDNNTNTAWIDYDDGYFKPVAGIDTTHPFYDTNNTEDIPVLDHPGMAYACIEHTTDESKEDHRYQFYILGDTGSDYTVYLINARSDKEVGELKLGVNTVVPSGTPGFIGRNRGINSVAKDLIVTDVKTKLEKIAKHYIVAIEFYSGSSSYLLDISSSNLSVNNLDTAYYVPRRPADGAYSLGNSLNEGPLTSGIIYAINAYLQNLITSNVVGLSYNGDLIFNINNSYIRVNTVKAKLRKYEFEVDTETISDSDEEWMVKLKANMNVTDYSVICDISLMNNLTYPGNQTSHPQKSTLMPLTSYDVYIHEVDNYGIIKDGIKIGTASAPTVTTFSYSGYNNLDLKITINNGTDDYVGTNAFFSIINTGHIVARCFDYVRIGNDNYLSCLELDSLLYNESNDFGIVIVGGIGKTIISNNGAFYASGIISGQNDHFISQAVEYLPSSTIKPSTAFGNCGLIHWTGDVNYNGAKFYFVLPRKINDSRERKLIKASHYFNISLAQNDDPDVYSLYPVSNASDVGVTKQLDDSFYGSYLCNVRKPSIELSSSVYVSGNDIYAIKRPGSAIKLEDFTSLIQTTYGPIRQVQSNFNLNYLSLTEEINDKLFKVGNSASGVKQVARVINSATLSYIYELRSMYKDFFNVSFRPVQRYYKTKFNNTIRVSNVLSDETYNNDIYRFRPVDYYNAPTDRGKIVKLFSIGNNIYVHTERSLYKFDGNQTITASKSDITLKESEPFETGIVQLFDSEYGYGGIKEKSASCVTFDAYFFYDQENNHIFGYRDNQPVLLDGSIKGFLDTIKNSVTTCNVVHDVNNNRVLFGFDIGYVSIGGIQHRMTFAISYNYKSKTFVSLHSINLKYCFNSKNNVYYSHNSTLEKLFVYSSIINANIYGSATNNNSININLNTLTGNSDLNMFEIAIICFPKSQLLESIEFVKYIGRYVNNLYSIVTQGQAYGTYPTYPGIDCNFNQFNDNIIHNPVKSAYIITDRCRSNVIYESNDDIESFKFERGTWNFNYFRNVKDSTDTYNYHDDNSHGSHKDPNTNAVTRRTVRSDLNSLVYGRYFIVVLRFIETTPVKLEDIFVQTEQY